MTILLVTNESYDQDFIKRLSIQTTVKISLKFYFELELHFELCSQSVDYHNAHYWDSICSYYFATERLLIWIPFDLLEGVYSTSFCIFKLWQIQLMTRCSERILFVSWGVPVYGIHNDILCLPTYKMKFFPLIYVRYGKFPYNCAKN